MTLVDSYFPFDSGPGAGATQARWRVMSRTLGTSGIIPGYLNSMAPTIAGSVVTINTGAAWIDGFYGEITSTTPAKNVTVTGAGMVVACADPTDHSVKIFFRAGQVTPAQPTNGQGIFEIPLAQITGTSTFTLTDTRQYAYGSVMPCGKLVPTAATNSTKDGWLQIVNLTAAFLKGGMTAASSALTATTPGTYRVTGAVLWQNGAGGAPAIGRYIAAVYVNGNEQCRDDRYLSTASQWMEPQTSTLVNLNRGDVITLWGYSANGAAGAGSYNNGAYTYLAAEMVSR